MMERDEIDQPDRPSGAPTSPRRALPVSAMTVDTDSTSVSDNHGVEAPAEDFPDKTTHPVDPLLDPFDEPARLLGGRYELDEVIGRGGMAEVRRAYDTRLGRWVAVKELRPDLASDPTFQARFRREAQSAAGLNHPNIVAVYDTGEEHDPLTRLDIPYIVMELVEGQTLRDILKDGRKILPERALEMTAGVLDALSYSHKAGIIHRDIKPANVMLTPQGAVKVMDFGIARAVSDASSSMTQTAAVIGTAQYLSPEQARGMTVDARSDIYSAGCLLYELLLGRPPFTGDSPVSVAYQHVRELPTPPSQLNPAITPEIDAIALTALAKDPGERYQTARAMSDDIQRLLAGEEVEATRMHPLSAASASETTNSVAVTRSPTYPEESSRRRRFPILIVLLVLLLTGLVTGGYFYMQDNADRRVQAATMVSVPGVEGKKQAEAESAIKQARLVPVVQPTDGPEDTVGTVVRQSPARNTPIRLGEQVTLVVNAGPTKKAIPTGLKGRTVDEARQQLNDAGFTNVDVTDAAVEPIDAREGTVVTVDPGEGTEVTPSARIQLQVAKGVSDVPNWVGLKQAEVEKDREAKGFEKVKFESRETNVPDQIGTVISTFPSAGQKVNRKNDQIIVYVGRAAPRPTAAAPTSAPTTTQAPSTTRPPQTTQPPTTEPTSTTTQTQPPTKPPSPSAPPTTPSS